MLQQTSESSKAGTLRLEVRGLMEWLRTEISAHVERLSASPADALTQGVVNLKVDGDQFAFTVQ